MHGGTLTVWAETRDMDKNCQAKQYSVVATRTNEYTCRETAQHQPNRSKNPGSATAARPYHQQHIIISTHVRYALCCAWLPLPYSQCMDVGLACSA